MITQLIEHGALDHDSAMVVADDKHVLLDLAHVGMVRRTALQSWHLVGGALSMVTMERKKGVGDMISFEMFGCGISFRRRTSVQQW